MFAVSKSFVQTLQDIKENISEEFLDRTNNINKDDDPGNSGNDEADDDDEIVILDPKPFTDQTSADVNTNANTNTNIQVINTPKTIVNNPIYLDYTTNKNDDSDDKDIKIYHQQQMELSSKSFTTAGLPRISSNSNKDKATHTESTVITDKSKNKQSFSTIPKSIITKSTDNKSTSTVITTNNKNNKNTISDTTTTTTTTDTAATVNTDDSDDTVITKELINTNTIGDDDNVDDYVATLVSAVAKSEITRLKNRSQTDVLNPKIEALKPKKEATRPFLPRNTDLKPFDYTDEDDTSDLNGAQSTLLDPPLTDTPNVPIQPIPLPVPKTNLRQAKQSLTDSASTDPKDDVTTSTSKLTPSIPQATYDRPKKGTLTCSNGRRDNSEVIYWWYSPADRSFISPLIPPSSATRPKTNLKGSKEGPKYVTFEYDHGGCK